MRVLLVNMPWASINMPSLALGILRRAAAEALPDIDIDVMHANIDYVDWVTGQLAFTLWDYHFYSLSSYFDGLGDWVFTSALYDDPEWGVAELREQVPMSQEHLETSLNLHRSAPRFVDEITARILAFEPDLVGFTSTFQQNVPALAVARAIKKAAPHVLTAMGGANCDGPQGEALHRNFGFIDFVMRGEGDVAFPRLLAAVRAGEGLEAVPGLCWRGSAGGSVPNPMSTRPLAPGKIPTPDYDGYFDRLEASIAWDWVEPKLVVEGARGCWWGEKHHCKFCGLNGSFMEFRSKSPGEFWREIVELARRHQVLDMYVVDNILDMGYVNSLLPMIIESGYDLRITYEIKSNMRRGQLEALVAAGVVVTQPGIESLNSRVLKLMDKGVTGCQNVRMLRDASSVGLSVVWNYLYGFPGEDPADYLPVIDQFPALHHLPPMKNVGRIAIERFSPYFDQSELGFSKLKPDSQYRRNYDLPESELFDMAYLFSAPAQGVSDSIGDQLRIAGDTWQRAYAHSRLSHTDLGAEILLVSRRAAFNWSTMRISDPLEVAVFRLLDQPRSLATLCRKLALAHEVDEPALQALLRHWVGLGVLFTESDHYVHVAMQSANQEMMRIDVPEPIADAAGVSA